MNDVKPLYPENDKTLDFTLRKAGSGKYSEPLTTGTVTAFLSAAAVIGSATADPSLTVTCTHLGAGIWRANWPSTSLGKTLLDSKFAAGGVAYAHCVASGGVNQSVRMQYLTTAPAET